MTKGTNDGDSDLLRPNEVSVDLLSKREREVFDLVAAGFSGVEISKKLGISKKTVETHRHGLNVKLGIHSSAELVRFAALRGLLMPAMRAAGVEVPFCAVVCSKCGA